MENRMSEWLHPLLNIGQCRSGFTSRGEIVDSYDPYDGFSLCHYSGDTDVHVAESRQALSEATGVHELHIIVPTQTHSVKVMEIQSLSEAIVFKEECDGLVTRLRNVIIGVNTADCVPVVLIDPVSATIGVAHAGWRGALGGIVENTIRVMLRIGAKVEDIYFALGPSICVECFEVGEEVATLFPKKFVHRRQAWPRPHVDLQGYVRDLLLKAGLDPKKGTDWDSEMCTHHNPDRYFSARALGSRSGRGFTFARII